MNQFVSVCISDAKLRRIYIFGSEFKSLLCLPVFVTLLSLVLSSLLGKKSVVEKVSALKQSPEAADVDGVAAAVVVTAGVVVVATAGVVVGTVAAGVPSVVATTVVAAVVSTAGVVGVPASVVPTAVGS